MSLTKLLVSDYESFEHLYVHVPFCARFCTYCDFKKTIYNKTLFASFINNLEYELSHFSLLLQKVKTLYLGGGTPNILSFSEMKKFLEIINKYVKFVNNHEFTIECHPNCWKSSHLQLFLKYNINRISLGIQTTNDTLNLSFNRAQSINEVVRIFYELKTYPTFTLSYDFILNLYSQNLKNIKEDLNFINNYPPNHISWYSLMLKENTPLFYQKKELEDNDFLFTKYVQKELKKLGFYQYEICNYAKNNHFAQHNLAYWLSNQYLGIGWGSASLLKNKTTLNYFIRRIEGTLLKPEEMLKTLNKKEFFLQVLMMGLRLIQGINITMNPYKNAYLFYKKQISTQIKEGYLKIKNHYLFCTKKGLDFLNTVLLNIMSD